MEDNRTENDLGMKPLNDDFFKGGQRVAEVKKSKLVFVVGILFVIFGGIGLLSSIFSMMNQGMSLEGYKLFLTPEGVEKMSKILPMLLMFSLFESAVQLLAGILGILFCRKPEKAFWMISFGILLIGMVVIGTFITKRMMNELISTYMSSGMGMNEIGGMKAMQGLTDASGWIAMLIGLVLPILYTIGGFLLNKRKGIEGENYGGSI